MALDWKKMESQVASICIDSKLLEVSLHQFDFDLKPSRYHSNKFCYLSRWVVQIILVALI